MNNARSSLSLIVINTTFIYAFGGYPLSYSSIELFYESQWQVVKLKEGDHYIQPFWAGSHLSDKLDGSIFIFGGGLKYNDGAECYDFNADNREVKKLKMMLPKEDRFYYNNQKIILGENKFITMGRHGIYKFDFEKRTCFKLCEGYRDLENK